VTRADVLAGWTKRHAVDGRLMFHKSTGCEKCDHTGLKGRAGIHEMMVISRELRRLVQTALGDQLARALISGYAGPWVGVASHPEASMICP